MSMMFNVLKHYHPMIGVPWLERHQTVFPPPLPPPPAPLPHFCFAILCSPPWGLLAGKPNPSVLADAGINLSQGNDSGPLIPDINVPPGPSPNLLLPVIFLTSGSKCHFGSSKHVLGQGPIAFACLNVIHFNLNCAGPTWPPLPSGLVIPFATETTGVTPGDLVGGFLHMVADAAIQYGLNRLFNSSKVANLMERLTFRVFGGMVSKFAGFGINYHAGEWLGMTLSSLASTASGKVWANAAGQLLDNLLPSTIATLIGSPVGYSPGVTPIGGFGGGLEDRGHKAVQQAVDNYLNDPAVETHSSPPPTGPPPADAGASPPTRRRVAAR